MHITQARLILPVKSIRFIIKSWCRTYNSAIIINCSNNFGPAQNVEKVIPLSIDRLLNKKIMGIYGTGENVRDWLLLKITLKR